MGETMKKQHFVLVHGACHGAWCWYKLRPRLTAAGYRVTVLDLAASGINMKSIKDLCKFEEYSEPLLEFLGSMDPAGSSSCQKVILVGHSLGGLSLAMAMDKFRDKISVAVFLAAFMPDTQHNPGYVFDRLVGNYEDWSDTKFESYGSDNSLVSVMFGPKFMESKLYQLSPPEDLELALTLARPVSFFLSDLLSSKNLSEQGYGSVPRVYMVCKEDKAVPVDFQRWMIRNSPAQEVIEIDGADHMPMFSKPTQVCDRLLEIANKYA